jgi:hypothetical protein
MDVRHAFILALQPHPRTHDTTTVSWLPAFSACAASFYFHFMASFMASINTLVSR